MKILIFTIIALFFYGNSLHSQDIADKPLQNWSKYIHLESGFMYPSGTIKENIAIRQNISSYYVNQGTTGEINSETSGFIVGLRWEFFNPKFKTGISGGLRYTGFSTDISGYSSYNADFFYLRYSELNSDTKFARVKSLNESNNFLTIPLELRLIPIEFRGIKLFAKAGAEISTVNLKRNTRIVFQDKSMESNEELILKSMGVSANKFYSTLYGSLGASIGKEDKANYIFEVFLPSFFISKNNFSLTNVDYFDGFKFSVQFPIH